MRIVLSLIISLVLCACTNLEFVYKDNKNLKNPLYDNTKVIVSGKDLAFMKSYIPHIAIYTLNTLIWDLHFQNLRSYV